MVTRRWWRCTGRGRRRRRSTSASCPRRNRSNTEGYVLTLENPYEGSVLSYRHDPGVATLYIAITAFLIGLAIRTYWPSYRVQLWVEDGGRGRLTFRAAGMLGEPEDIEDALVEELESGAG